MKFADYRPWLPKPDESRIAGDTAESHAAGRLATPRAKSLFNGWAKIARQPFRGLTCDGSPQQGLFDLHPESAPVESMLNAAQSLLSVLTEDEKKRALLPLDSDQWRNWQNTEILVESHGLHLHRTGPDTREKVLDLLRSSLSDQGYQNTIAVMQLNGFLGDLFGAPGVLSEWSYNFCLYGIPHREDPWGWQIWGHHLAVSCVIVKGHMVLTPCFLGAEICYADQGRFKGLTLFQDHEYRGLQLMNGLPDSLQKRALVGRDLSGSDLPEGRVHFADYLMLGGAYQDNRIVPYEGALAAEFSPTNRNRLLDLVDAYIGNMPDGPRQSKMQEFEKHLQQTHFCWIGGKGPDDPFYYRIQSPVTFIEFDHHPGLFLTNTQALKFHIHTVVRTPNGNDYGIDVLRQHYLHSKHGHAHDHDH